MKTMIRMMAAATVLVAAHSLVGQIPAGAPAGSTGQCKDGTYSTAPSKSGACSGHKGVKDWYAAAPAKAAPAMPAPTAVKAAPAAVAAPTPAAAPVAARPVPAPAPAPVAARPAPSTAATAKLGPAAAAAAKPQAPGGGPGMVWVNTESKVYHCPGTTFYGKTKDGKYMSEAEAKAMGAHADHKKACTT